VTAAAAGGGVVSLVPSITETLLAWGVPVAACTRFCEQPDLVHVGGTKDPDIDAIVALAPSLVVVDREENRRDDAEALRAAGLDVHVTHVTSLADVVPMLAALADVVGVVGVDRPSMVDAAPEPVWTSAFVAIWKRPWMSINDATYGSSLLRALGVDNVLGTQVDTYPSVEPADVVPLAPELVLLPSEPYPFAERHLAEAAELFPGSTPVLLDGRDLFWWGARTPAALERLRAALRAAHASR
jgi:ABC-type Fe3+-hydroxamate transport system substrate-binding protein